MKKYLVYISCIFNIALTQATSFEEYFEQATKAYNQGNYAQAIDYYQQILKSEQESVALYYNLANAYYKNSEVAPSIYYYEKALKLSPNDSEVKNNLAFAQLMTIDKITPTPKDGITHLKEGIISLYSVQGWAIQSIVGVLLLVLSFLIYYFTQQTWKKRLFFAFMLFFCGVSAGSYIMASVAEINQKKQVYGILFDKKVSIYAEPNTYSQEILTLHEGTKIQVIDSLDDWTKILIADGRLGWVKNTSFRVL